MRGTLGLSVFPFLVSALQTVFTRIVSFAGSLDVGTRLRVKRTAVWCHEDSILREVGAVGKRPSCSLGFLRSGCLCRHAGASFGLALQAAEDTQKQSGPGKQKGK